MKKRRRDETAWRKKRFQKHFDAKIGGKNNDADTEQVFVSKVHGPKPPQTEPKGDTQNASEYWKKLRTQKDTKASKTKPKSFETAANIKVIQKFGFG